MDLAHGFLIIGNMFENVVGDDEVEAVIVECELCGVGLLNVWID